MDDIKGMIERPDLSGGKMIHVLKSQAAWLKRENKGKTIS